MTLCYETFGDPDDTPILLIMGLATQMIAWHEDFCEELAERGFYVVRFDNRDIGRSTHFDFRPPSVKQMLTPAPPADEQYSLSDMAEDTAVLLRELGIAPAHVVGASMGGMIGQMLAAEHPEVVRSLTSIMSTTGSRLHGQPAFSVYRYLLQPSAPRPRRLHPALRRDLRPRRLDRLRPRRAVRPRAGGRAASTAASTSGRAAASWARSSPRATGPRR